MHWFWLVCAGLFEIGFTTFMKLSEGFKKWPFTLAFIACASSSFYLLTIALKQLPLGTAYAVWTGIGAFGTAVVGIVFFQESTHSLRIFFLLLIIISVIGLKYVES